MLQKGVNELVATLFIHGTSHRNLSGFYLVHNLFWKSNVAREIRLNAKYISAFWSPSDHQPLLRLGQQIFPRHLHHFEDALSYCMSRPHGYLVIQTHPNVVDEFRPITNIFGDNSLGLPQIFRSVF